MLGLSHIALCWFSYLMVLLAQAEADVQSCPTTSWSSWSSCSTNCGIGTKRRTRKISGTPSNKECIRWTQLVDTAQCQDMTGCSPEQRNNICSINFDRGQCLASFPVWTYNSGKGLCEEAVYGGCNGNENRFSSQKECEIGCQSGKDQNVCSLQFDRGLCLASFPVWTYNSKTRTCVEVIYGGCGGNGNRFKTAEDCRKTCPSA